MKKGKKIILLIITMILSIINIEIVKADTKDIEVESINIKEKSGTITIVNPEVDKNNIIGNITFNEVNDFVMFELKIKNNQSDKYKIESIKDNNKNDNIIIDYSYDEDYIEQDETSTILVKLTYKNKLINVEKININDLILTLSLSKEDGTTSTAVINNPKTSDSILKYLILLIISITGLIFAKKNYKYNKIKIGSILVILSIVFFPFVAFAKEDYIFNIKFSDIAIKGEFEKYNIIINSSNGSTPIVKEVTYGDTIGNLPNDPVKDGYLFDKWEDSDGNPITEDSIIKKQTNIIAKYNPIEYTITYNLNGGTATNISKYTIESDDITLNNPTKEGYTFIGWTGTGIEEKTTRVIIEKGSTEDREYTANYSANTNTKYKVTHKYQNLDGTYTEEIVTEYGETDREVDAPLQPRNGYKNPTIQKVTISADGTSTVTYTYEREKYNFSISDRTYVDSNSTENGEYPFETEISIKAVERAGYDFVWSDGETELERTFNIKESTTLTPIYTARTDTAYKVIHQKQKLTMDGYEVVSTQNFTGKTDTEVTPSVNSYEGFETPRTQTVTIAGDGLTVVTYSYNREMYTFSTNNNEIINSTKEDGTYPYGTEITLTANNLEDKTFTKWSNNETENPLTIILDDNLTIEPIYQLNSYTVTFNTSGGTTIDNQTVDYGQKATKPTTDPTKTDYKFDNWYTDDTYQTKFDFDTPITEDTTIYAKFLKKEFLVVFSEPGECVFNGSNGVITGDDCGYANGVNKYIDTGINLYSEENHDKDYEIGFTIVSYDPSVQVSQATFMNTKLEGNNYPGLVFRRRNNITELDLSSRQTSSANKIIYINSSGVEKVKIYRIKNKTTGIQEIFYSINDGEKILVNNLSQFNPVFDLSVWFGAAPTNASALTAQRILIGTMKDMYIKLETYR